MSLVDRASIWWTRQQPRRRRRDHELRANYQGLVLERPRSLDERVQFHLDNLDEYWDRCVGFLELRPEHSPTFVVADWAVCVYVASEAAAADVRSYCAAHGASALGAAWERYARSLLDMAHAHPTVPIAVRRGADEFRRVRAAHGQAPHVVV